MDLHLDIDAPRTDEYTLQVAQGMAEAVRVLNHATYSSAAASQPSTIYRVLSNVHATLSGIPQLLTQLSYLIGQLLATGRLYDDRDRDDAELAAHTVAVIQEALADRRIADAMRESSHLGLHDTEVDGG
jgi:hypothetical protein